MTKYRSGIILLYDDNVLLIKTEDTNGREIWGFPKGKIRKGDSPKDTAEREFFEETGIITRLSDNSRHIRLSNSHFYIKRITTFLPVHYSMVRDKNEIKDIRWMNILDLLYFPHENVQRYVRLYLDKYIKPYYL